jgi:4-diphosphocytidyl-2-C-methyl-D-erythritol kinase
MLTLQAPAKINWFLNVRGVRPDGFHSVVTVLQTISLFDTLTLNPNAAPGFTCSDPSLETDDNLVLKAARLFWQETGLAPVPLAIHLHKRIPHQAGLGGGSADAAAMLLGLIQLTGGHSWSDLTAMAAQLGSDVPFFLTGGTALATGRGEVITPLDVPLPTVPLYLVKAPGVGIATAQAYGWLKAEGLYPQVDPAPLLAALKAGKDIRPFVYNDFQRVAAAQHPALFDGLPQPALLCGSGSAIACFNPPQGAHWAVHPVGPTLQVITEHGQN